MGSQGDGTVVAVGGAVLESDQDGHAIDSSGFDESSAHPRQVA
jgi:hypothetical protein